MSRYEQFPIHLVSVVRNEEQYLPGLVDSILSQEERPYKWTIVDDGSTDDTPSIIDALERDYDWVRRVRAPDRGYNDRGHANSTALRSGFETALQNSQVEAIGVLDADITFNELTMSQIYDAFLNNDNLGIYGGEIVELRGDQWVPPVTLPEDFVRGACKLYRRKCYDDIGGILTRRGWDSIDNLKAAMHGWDVKRDAALLIRHHRPVGTTDGFVKDQWKVGRDAHYIGSDPLLVLARGMRKMVKTKPYFLGGMIFLSAYFKNRFFSTEQYPDPQLLQFVQKRHREILLQGFYKW